MVRVALISPLGELSLNQAIDVSSAYRGRSNQRFAPDEAVVCGMSLGYADEQAAVNDLAMPREPLEGFTRWLGFNE